MSVYLELRQIADMDRKSNINFFSANGVPYTVMEDDCPKIVNMLFVSYPVISLLRNTDLKKTYFTERGQSYFSRLPKY